MIRLWLGAGEPASVRLAVSPLWETAASLVLLSRQASPPWPYGEWARRVPRDVLHEDLLTAFRSEGPLGALRAPPAPGASIADELRALPEPTAAQRVLRHRLLVYWEAAIAPYWPALRAAAEDDLVKRAQCLAVHGPHRLLAELGDRIDPGRLTLDSQHHADLHVADRRLVLVPLVFGRAGSLLAEHPEHGVALSYQASGAVVLGGRPGDRPGRGVPSADDRLSILVGRSRARIIRTLSMPHTVSAAAAALGMATSTVSEHIGILLAAGVLRRRRSGRRVIYELDSPGMALLDHLGAAD